MESYSLRGSSEGNPIGCCGFKRSGRVDMVNVLPAPTAGMGGGRGRRRTHPKVLAKLSNGEQRGEKGQRIPVTVCPGMLFLFVVAHRCETEQRSGVHHLWMSCQNNTIKGRQRNILPI